MTTLTAARKQLATSVGSLPYVPNVIDPPCVLIEPGDPYLAYDEHYKYAGYVASMDVYVLVSDDDNEAKGDQLDTKVMATLAAIEADPLWGVLRIAKPGLHFTADWQAYGVQITVQARVSRT